MYYFFLGDVSAVCLDGNIKEGPMHPLNTRVIVCTQLRRCGRSSGRHSSIKTFSFPTPYSPLQQQSFWPVLDDFHHASWTFQLLITTLACTNSALHSHHDSSTSLKVRSLSHCPPRSSVHRGRCRHQRGGQSCPCWEPWRPHHQASS